MSCLTEIKIEELLGYKFFIPSYQRGYRWTEQQVEDLLNDIWEFSIQMEQNHGSYYCLQPVVVKNQNPNSNKIDVNNNKNQYEVIDGQQRLTTVFLVLKCFEQDTNFEIEYETRETSKEFLENITENQVNDNIDYFHIYNAYKTIKDWFKDKDEKKFKETFLSSTKVIWYEVDVDNDAVTGADKDIKSIDVFTRINMGKIKLTSAELIKALFLNSSNFSNAEPEKLRLKQLEIASEWDRIEYALQNDELWYFIRNSQKEFSTHIDYIFEIIYSIAEENYSQNDFKTNYGHDEYSPFRFFAEKFKDKGQCDVEKNWEEIKNIYQTIEEWFLDRELYHKIGYLIATGTKIKDLLKRSTGETKQDFKKFLDDKIKEKVKDCTNLKELEYGNNNDLIKKILLLHNIQTLLNNKNETTRFPFNRYKKEDWDIEHIHAIATELPKDKQARIDWLDENKIFINEVSKNSELIEKIENFKRNYEFESGNFEKLSVDILDFFKGNHSEFDYDNDISNLVLLDSSTNRSYKNAFFPKKRNFIIKKEKEGKFIPICTRNVFLKFYNDSKNLTQMTFWGNKDRKAYMGDIVETLKIYLPKQNEENDVQ